MILVDWSNLNNGLVARRKGRWFPVCVSCGDRNTEPSRSSCPACRAVGPHPQPYRSGGSTGRRGRRARPRRRGPRKLWAAYESLAACLSDLAALHEPVPAADLAECLPYSGAGPEEGQAVLDALEDRGWRIVRGPQATEGVA